MNKTLIIIMNIMHAIIMTTWIDCWDTEIIKMGGGKRLHVLQIKQNDEMKVEVRLLHYKLRGNH